MEAKDKKEKTAEKVMSLADMKQLAHDYVVPMSDGTLEKIAKDMTPEKSKAFEDYIKTAAQGLYPTLAAQIKAGIPTAYLLDPYRQVGKQMLGEDFEPDFQGDPKSIAALGGSTDPETGRPAPMNLDQWRSHIKTHPGFGWDQTQAAADEVNNVMGGLQGAMSAPLEEGMM